MDQVSISSSYLLTLGRDAVTTYSSQSHHLLSSKLHSCNTVFSSVCQHFLQLNGCTMDSRTIEVDRYFDKISIKYRLINDN